MHDLNRSYDNLTYRSQYIQIQKKNERSIILHTPSLIYLFRRLAH